MSSPAAPVASYRSQNLESWFTIGSQASQNKKMPKIASSWGSVKIWPVTFVRDK